MGYTWDEVKRRNTVKRRKLDFADCAEVFAGPHLSFPDTRFDYEEERTVTVGFLPDGRMVALVHTEDGENTRIISMRKLNGRERKKFEEEIG
jgi:uncharacterized protein